MPSDYTVEDVKPAEQWSNEHGRFQPYDLKLSGIEGTAQINRKLKDGAVPEDKIPKPGQSLYLSLTSTDYGFRAKEEQRQEGQQAMPAQTNGGSAPQGDSPDQAYWTAKDRRIQRQHSQEMALRVVDASGFFADLPLDNPDVAGESLKVVRRLADFFDADVLAVSDRVLKEERGKAADADVPF